MPIPGTVEETRQETMQETMQESMQEAMQETTQKTLAPEPDIHTYVLQVRAESQEYLKKQVMDEVKQKDDQRAVCTLLSRVFQNEVFPLRNPCHYCNQAKPMQHGRCCPQRPPSIDEPEQVRAPPED